MEGAECQRYILSICEGHNKHCIEQTNPLVDKLLATNILQAQKGGKFSDVFQKGQEPAVVGLTLCCFGVTKKNIFFTMTSVYCPNINMRVKTNKLQI